MNKIFQNSCDEMRRTYIYNIIDNKQDEICHVTSILFHGFTASNSQDVIDVMNNKT